MKTWASLRYHGESYLSSRFQCHRWHNYIQYLRLLCAGLTPQICSLCNKIFQYSDGTRIMGEMHNYVICTALWMLFASMEKCDMEIMLISHIVLQRHIFHWRTGSLVQTSMRLISWRSSCTLTLVSDPLLKRHWSIRGWRLSMKNQRSLLQKVSAVEFAFGTLSLFFGFAWLICIRLFVSVAPFRYDFEEEHLTTQNIRELVYSEVMHWKEKNNLQPRKKQPEDIPNKTDLLKHETERSAATAAQKTTWRPFLA